MGALATSLSGAPPRPTVWDKHDVRHGPGTWARVGAPICPFQYWRALLALGGPAGAQLAGMLWLTLSQGERDEVAAEFEEWKVRAV